MAVDVSTLSIKVVSSGIDDSTAKLDKLSGAADKAEVATKKFSTSSSSSYQAVTKELQNLQRVANTTSIVPASSGTAAAVAEIKMVTNAIANVGTQSKKAADESKNAFQAIGGSIANLRTLLGGGLVMGGLVGLSSSVIEMADSWKLMNARLTQVVGSSAAATKAQEDLFNVSMKLRVPLEGVVQLYTRAVPAIAAYGYSAKDALSVTTALSAALKASGATGAEASSVMLQFSQSLAAGRLNGAEFNAVAEGAPIVLRALENSLVGVNGKIGITRAELKKMGAEGTLDVAKIIPVMKEMEAKWTAMANSLPITFESAMGMIKTSFTKALGENTVISQFTTSLAKSLEFIARNANMVVNVVGGALFIALANYTAQVIRSTAVLVINTATTFANTRAQQANAVASGEAAIAMGAVATANTAAAATSAASSGAMAGLAAMLKFSFNPIVLGITAAILAGAAAWAFWGDSAVDAAEKARDRIRKVKLAQDDMNRDELQAAKDLFSEQQKTNEARIKQTEDYAKKYGQLIVGKDGNVTTKVNVFAEAQYGAEYAQQQLDKYAKQYKEYLNTRKGYTKDISDAQDELNRKTQIEIDKQNQLKEMAADAAAKKVMKKYDIQGNWEDKAAEIKRSFGARLAATKEGSKEYQDLAEKMKLAIDAHDKLNPATIAATEAERKRAKELRASQAAQAKKTAATNLDTEAQTAYSNALQSVKDFQDKLNQTEADHKSLLIDIHNKSRQAVDDINQKTAAIEAERKGTVLTAAAKIAMDAQEKQASVEALDAKIREQEVLRENSTMTLLDAQRNYDAQVERIKQIGDATDAESKQARAQAVNQLQFYQGEIKKQTAINQTIEALTAQAKGTEDVVKALNAQAFSQAMKDMESVGRSLGQTLSEGFGEAAKSLGNLMTVFEDYSKQQQKIEQDKEAALKAGGDAAKVEQAYITATAKLSSKAYTDMLGAAKGLLKEKTTGYKVLNAAEKAFRTYEMLMAAKSFAQKMFFTEAEQVANEKKSAMAIIGLLAEKAATLALNIVKGIGAILGQGSGDPYTAFARMAAMAAIVAGLGIAIGGSGGGGSQTSAEETQANAGTGSILGDLTAKSESISKSIALLEENSSLSVDLNAGMLASLKNIEASMTGFTSVIIRSGIIGNLSMDSVNKIGSVERTVDNILGKTGLGRISIGEKLTGEFGTKLLNNVIGKIFGGKKTVEDYGITSGKQSLGSIASGGLMSQGYTNIKKSGGWFSKDKYSTVLSDLPQEVSAQFSMVVNNMRDGVLQAGKVLGMGSGFAGQLDKFVVNIGNISLKGLSAEEIQKQFSNIFSKLGDDLAKFGFGEELLAKYQKVGEGAFETLLRVASAIATVDGLFLNLGVDLSTVFKDVGGSSIDAKMQLIEFAGGLDNLSKSLGAYYDKYYTEAEKQQISADQVASKLKAMGISVGIGADEASTLANFRKQVEIQQGRLDTESGRRAYAALLEIAPQFADIAGYLSGLKNAASGITGTSTQAEIDAAKAAILKAQQFEQGVVPAAVLDAANAWWEAKGGPAAMDTQQVIADGITNINDLGAKDKTIADMAAQNAASTAATIDTLKQVVAQQQATNAILMAKIDSLTLAVAESGKRVVNAVVDTSTAVTR